MSSFYFNSQDLKSFNASCFPCQNIEEKIIIPCVKRCNTTLLFTYLLCFFSFLYSYPEERKIISVDNDSPPPPYSPPQNADSLAQTLAALSIPPPSRPRARGAEPPMPNNPSTLSQAHVTTRYTVNICK